MYRSARIQKSSLSLLVMLSLFGFQISSMAQSLAEKVKLEEGTQVRLKLMESLSSATAQAGQVVSFEVLDTVRVEDTVVIAEGAPAWATIVEAEGKKSFGRAGKLAFRLDYVKAVDGSKVPLRATSINKGKGKGVAAGAVIAASALFFFPAAPLAIFIKGKNVEVPRGQHLQAFVDGDRWVEIRQELAKQPVWDQIHGTKIQQEVKAGESKNLAEPVKARSGVQLVSLDNQQVSPSRPASSEFGAVNIISEPGGAEIEVDGAFYGNTPATLRLPAGMHTFTVSLTNHAPYRRTINIGPGSNLTLKADIQPSGAQEPRRMR